MQNDIGLRQFGACEEIVTLKAGHGARKVAAVPVSISSQRRGLQELEAKPPFLAPGVNLIAVLSSWL